MSSLIGDKINKYHEVKDVVVDDPMLKIYRVVTNMRRMLTERELHPVWNQVDPEIEIGIAISRTLSNEHKTRSIYSTVRR